MAGKCYIGTSGFSYADWKIAFYPAGLKSSEYLTYYATKFNCVEINSSFYRIPLKKTVENWVDKVPDAFRFCPKLYRGITHYRKFKNSEELLHNYFEVISAFKDKLGPVLIQLPKNFIFHYDLTEAFFELLHSEYSQYDFAIETRHSSWHDEDALGLLAKYGIAHTIADAGKHHFATYFAVTSNEVYIRFHGREQLYATNYKNAELKEYAVHIKAWLGEGKHVWVFFNNTAGGYAIKNAFTLKKMVGG